MGGRAIWGDIHAGERVLCVGERGVDPEAVAQPGCVLGDGAMGGVVDQFTEPPPRSRGVARDGRFGATQGVREETHGCLLPRPLAPGQHGAVEVVEAAQQCLDGIGWADLLRARTGPRGLHRLAGGVHHGPDRALTDPR